MANYSLVIDSTFKPFTYQELAAPLDRQEAYQERIEEAYEQLSSQADVLEAMGANDRDKNSKTYGRYKAYSDSLRNEADNLYRFGLNSESRQRLTDLRRRYNQEIIPIQNAWQKREEEAKMQLTASMQNPSIMFTRDAKNTTLDEYINNPTGGFGVISGAQITAQMSQMAKNLAKKITSGDRSGIDDFTYDYIRRYGLTPDLIKDWRNNPTLSKMFEQVMQANGVTPEALQSSPNMEAIMTKSTGFAEMGMWDAIGEDKPQIIEDFKRRSDYNFGHQVALENLRHKHAMEQAGAIAGLNGEPDSPPGDTVQANYGDPAAAGKSLRTKMASAVADLYEKLKDNPKVAPLMKRYMGGEWGGHGSREKAVEYWADHGFNFNVFGTRLGDSIRNYLRSTVINDDNLISQWGAAGARTASAKTAGKPITSGSAALAPWRRDTDTPVTSLTPWSTSEKKDLGTPWKKKDNSETAPKVGYVMSDSKISWDKFDEAAHNGYYFNVTHLKDDRSKLNSHLAELFDRNSRYGDGTIAMYGIDRIQGGKKGERAEITYSNRRISRDVLPKKDDKGNIDYDKIHRYELPNGDIGYGWYDEKSKKFVVYGMMSGDDSLEQRAFKDNQNDMYRAASIWLSNGLFTPQEYNDYLDAMGKNRLGNDYIITQPASVEGYKVK